MIHHHVCRKCDKEWESYCFGPEHPGLWLQLCDKCFEKLKDEPLISLHTQLQEKLNNLEHIQNEISNKYSESAHIHELRNITWSLQEAVQDLLGFNKPRFSSQDPFVNLDFKSIKIGGINV